MSEELSLKISETGVQHLFLLGGRMGYFEVIAGQGSSKNVIWVYLNNLLSSYKARLFALAEHKHRTKLHQ
jgi:hypothetical protein